MDERLDGEAVRMLGRTGWFGQCRCCNGPRSKRQMRRYEKRRWLAQEIVASDGPEPDDPWDDYWMY